MLSPQDLFTDTNRRLQYLLKIGVLFAQSGGRSLHYQLNRK